MRWDRVCFDHLVYSDASHDGPGYGFIDIDSPRCDQLPSHDVNSYSGHYHAEYWNFPNGEVVDVIAPPNNDDGWEMTEEETVNCWKKTHAPGTMGGEIKRIVEGMEPK